MTNDQVAAEVLIRRMSRLYGRAVEQVIAQRTRDRRDVEEMVADVWWRALHHLPEVVSNGGDEQARRWLMTTAKNRAVDGWRADGRRRRLLGRIEQERIEESESAEDEFVRADAATGAIIDSPRAIAAMAGIAPLDRRILTMTGQGLTAPAVATALSMTAANVRQHLSRARRNFREVYAGLEDRCPEEAQPHER